MPGRSSVTPAAAADDQPQLPLQDARWCREVCNQAHVWGAASQSSGHEQQRGSSHQTCPARRQCAVERGTVNVPPRINCRGQRQRQPHWHAQSNKHKSGSDEVLQPWACAIANRALRCEGRLRVDTCSNLSPCERPCERTCRCTRQAEPATAVAPAAAAAQAGASSAGRLVGDRSTS